MMHQPRFLILLLALLAPLATRAELLLNEPFGYPDGSIINVAPDLWKQHSGVAGQLDVQGGSAFLTGGETEDVNRSFTGTGISTGLAFASFDLVLTGLPNSAGGYFFHFKDTFNDGPNTAFIGRVFARTTGAEAGKYRLAVSFGSGTAVALEKDLDRSTSYRIVVRLDFAATNATVWVNPATETTASDRAVSTDTRGVGLGMSQVAFRQATGIGDIRVDNLRVGTRFADVAEGGDPTQNPPILSTLPRQKTGAGVPVGPLAFTVADGETLVEELTVAGASSNETLVPVANITFGGVGAERAVTVTPAAAQQGIANITLTVRDTDGNSANRSFDLIVGEPALSGLTDLVTLPGVETNLVVNVSDPEGDALTVTATAVNAELLTAIAVSGTGPTRTLRITTSGTATGASRVEVVITDGFTSVTNGFNVTVAKTLGVILDEPFDYADETALNLTGLWIPHSGTNDGPVIVRGGKAQLMTTTTNREDINITYNSPTIRIADGVVLYARLDLIFNSIPTSAAGTYFAHYLGNANGSFRGRLFAGRQSAPSGQFQLGLANNAATASIWHPTQLLPGQPITVLIRYNVSTGVATLWVNPLNEGSPSVTGTDSPFPNDMVAFALRQESGFGSLDVDLLKIGTSYSDVLTPGVSLDYRLAATLNPDGSARFSFPAAALANGFVLQASTAPTDGWIAGPAVTTEGESAVLNIPTTAAAQFYRLHRP